MLREAQPERASLLVLPHHARYESILGMTRRGLDAAGIHVVLLREDGSYDCSTWEVS